MLRWTERLLLFVKETVVFLAIIVHEAKHARKESNMETLFCSVCGDRCEGSIHARIICEGCGNGIMLPVKGSLLYPED